MWLFVDHRRECHGLHQVGGSSKKRTLELANVKCKLMYITFCGVEGQTLLWLATHAYLYAALYLCIPVV